jgi:hypothetical protein
MKRIWAATTKSKYWIGTHDEAKIEKGFTSWILTQNPITLEQALEREKAEAKDGAKDFGDPNFHDVPNGGSLILA